LISVVGDPPELASVARADPVSIPIGGVTGTLEVDVPFALPTGVLPIGLQTVHVTISLKSEAGTRTYQAAPVLAGRQEGLDYQLSVGSVQVVIGGPLADLDRLDPASLTVNLDVAGLATGAHEVTPTVNLQTGLRLLRVDPVTVTISAIPGSGPSGQPAPSSGG
jgi:YbbR domain-containing protein